MTMMMSAEPILQCIDGYRTMYTSNFSFWLITHCTIHHQLIPASQLRDTDLTGRGARTVHNTLHQSFLDEKDKWRPIYKSIQKDNKMKRSIQRILMTWVQDNGGRFLKKCEEVENEGFYRVLTEEEILDRIAQALREDRKYNPVSAKQKKVSQQKVAPAQIQATPEIQVSNDMEPLSYQSTSAHDHDDDLVLFQLRDDRKFTPVSANQKKVTRKKVQRQATPEIQVSHDMEPLSYQSTSGHDHDDDLVLFQLREDLKFTPVSANQKKVSQKKVAPAQIKPTPEIQVSHDMEPLPYQSTSGLDHDDDLVLFQLRQDRKFNPVSAKQKKVSQKKVAPAQIQATSEIQVSHDTEPLSYQSTSGHDHHDDLELFQFLQDIHFLPGNDDTATPTFHPAGSAPKTAAQTSHAASKRVFPLHEVDDNCCASNGNPTPSVAVLSDPCWMNGTRNDYNMLVDSQMQYSSSMKVGGDDEVSFCTTDSNVLPSSIVTTTTTTTILTSDVMVQNIMDELQFPLNSDTNMEVGWSTDELLQDTKGGSMCSPTHLLQGE
jgi:hypothetical protein